MDEVLALCKENGWRVLDVAGDRVTLAISPVAISRMPALLSNALLERGVMLHEARPPFDLPCAWIEYDLASLRCVLHLVLNDSFLR